MGGRAAHQPHEAASIIRLPICSEYIHLLKAV